MERFGHMNSLFDNYDEDYDNFNERGADKMGIFNYHWTDFLNKKELKELDEVPELPTPAEFLPLDKAKKLELDSNQLEALYQEMKDASKEEGEKE